MRKYKGQLFVPESITLGESEVWVKNQFGITAGVDEAGRGPLAGPVVAGAVVWDSSVIIEQINDSKKLSAKKRDELYPVIKEKAVSWGIGLASPQEIDELNILQATFLAMRRALNQLDEYDFIVVDGSNLINKIDVDKQACVVKGDGKIFSIAAASILAKVHRDRLMSEYAEKYPQYKWKKNSGYPTAEHLQAIKEYGWTSLHRRSFRVKAFEEDPQANLFA